MSGTGLIGTGLSGARGVSGVGVGATADATGWVGTAGATAGGCRFGEGASATLLVSTSPDAHAARVKLGNGAALGAGSTGRAPDSALVSVAAGGSGSGGSGSGASGSGGSGSGASGVGDTATGRASTGGSIGGAATGVGAGTVKGFDAGAGGTSGGAAGVSKPRKAPQLSQNKVPGANSWLHLRHVVTRGCDQPPMSTVGQPGPGTAGWPCMVRSVKRAAGKPPIRTVMLP